MHWIHGPSLSVADDGGAAVMQVEDGWEALPFGFENGSGGVFPTREAAIDIVESMAGDVACCVGHLAEDSDR